VVRFLEVRYLVYYQFTILHAPSVYSIRDYPYRKKRIGGTENGLGDWPRWGAPLSGQIPTAMQNEKKTTCAVTPGRGKRR
jgi:hypothetical protein